MKIQNIKSGDIKFRGGMSESGFAMLFAVLVASILLAIGISIFSLTTKELILSAADRESQFSFYSADTGAECALYWDFQPSAWIFATSTDNTVSTPSNPDCVDTYGQAAQVITNTNYVTYTGYPIARGTTWAVTRFTLNIPSVSPLYCAIVTVVKDSTSGLLKTTIDSRGYNEPCSDTTDPNLVERALKVTY